MTSSVELSSSIGPESTGRHILIVDDETSIVRMMARYLSNRGNTVTTLGDPSEAWTLVSSHPKKYDALILDMNMPGMTGVEFVRRAREIAFARPILVMSGSVSEADSVALGKLGVTTILAKPFTLDELDAAVRDALSEGA